MHTLTTEQKIENLQEEKARLMDKGKRIKELVESINKKILKLQTSKSNEENSTSALDALRS